MYLSSKKNNQLYDIYINEGLQNANKKAYNNAEIDFLKAIDLDKKNHLAYINLSNIYLIQNKTNKCVKILIDYVSKFNSHESILSHTCKILYNYKYIKELLKLFKIAKLDSKKNYKKNYYLYFIQGIYYENEEKYDDAKLSFYRALSCNNLHFESYIKLLNLYEQTNDFQNFEKLLKKSFKNFKNKEYENILFLYKAIFFNREKRFNDSHNLILDNNLYFKLKTNKNYLAKLLDLEAKNNESFKNYSVAFKKIEERNNIISNLNENKKFDGNNIYNSLEKYKIFYNKKNVSYINSKLSYQNDENLVFLVGFPRSGTTLLDSILRSHSKITVLEEKPYLLNLRHDFFKQNNHDLSSLLNINQSVKDKIRNNYFKKIISHSNCSKKVIIDKFPLTIIELGFVKCIFPNSKIILAMRHPCDVVTSCFFSSFKINDAMVNFLKLDDTIKFYKNVFDLFDIYTKQLNLEFLTVKYEEIIVDLKNKSTQITNFLGLEYEDEMEKFFITARNRSKISTPSYSQVINPLYTTSIERWKNYPNAKKTERELSKWIKKFKY